MDKDYLIHNFTVLQKFINNLLIFDILLVLMTACNFVFKFNEIIYFLLFSINLLAHLLVITYVHHIKSFIYFNHSYLINSKDLYG